MPSGYVTLPNKQWREYEHQTTREYLAGDYDQDDMPSVARTMAADGWDIGLLQPEALVKGERYAVASAAIVRQAGVVLEGYGSKTTFQEIRTSLLPPGGEVYGFTPFHYLREDIDTTYSGLSLSLALNPDSDFGRLLERYEHFTEQDTEADPVALSAGFITRGGDLRGEAVRVLSKLKPAVHRFAESGGLDNSSVTDVYHSLTSLSLGDASIHAARIGSSRTRWEAIDPDTITVVQRNGVYAAVDGDGKRLMSGDRLPDPVNDRLVQAARPLLKCPAHSNLGLSKEPPASTALKRGLHAMVNEAAARGIL